MDFTSNKLWHGAPPTQLSRREVDVLGCLVEGKETPDIAKSLGVAVGTVKVHIASILTGLGLANRTQAAVWAVKNGYRYGESLAGAATEVGRRLPTLTNKETAVLALITEGYPDKVIARTLGKALSTIKVQVGSVTKKLGVSNRTQIAVLVTIADQLAADIKATDIATHFMPFEPNPIIVPQGIDDSPVTFTPHQPFTSVRMLGQYGLQKHAPSPPEQDPQRSNRGFKHPPFSLRAPKP